MQKKHNLSQVYIEEYKYIFSSKAMSVRGATVIAAFIEGQILALATQFFEERKIAYKPEARNEFYQSINVLETNKVIPTTIINGIKAFRTEGNKSIHGIFKGMTRKEWGEQNNRVVNVGRPVVKQLHSLLYGENHEII